MDTVLQGIGWLLLYFAICASAALALRFTVTIPDEIFRKTLHCILLGSLSVWVFVFDAWWIASLTAVAFALLVYPVLCAAEHLNRYSEVVTERKQGELKSSLLLVFFMFAFVVAVCWGLFDSRLLALASIYAWGFGDAAAALIGKRFGTHKIAGGRKSAEGSCAMFAVSLVSVLIVLLLWGGLPRHICMMISLVTALVSTIAELYTPNGLDTITCPLSSMVVLLSMVRMMGGGL